MSKSDQHTGAGESKHPAFGPCLLCEKEGVLPSQHPNKSGGQNHSSKSEFEQAGRAYVDRIRKLESDLSTRDDQVAVLERRFEGSTGYEYEKTITRLEAALTERDSLIGSQEAEIETLQVCFV